MDHVHAFGDDALGDLDATGVAARIASGEASAREVTEAAIVRAEKVNPALNGIQRANFEQARADSAHPAGGVFPGVPTFVKDNTDVAGLPTNQGSLAVNGRPALDHAPFTKQFLSTGMTVLGKTTMPEFGFNATTEYENLPPTRNPWNTGYSSGASSGGSAVMVASGVVPIAHANDGGGSIRIPAAACGLVGLKPTRGRVVEAAEAAKMPVNVVVNGVLTRSVRDTAHFFAGVENHFRNPSFERLGLVEGSGTRRLRIGLLVDSITGEPTDDETRSTVLDTAKQLEALGHMVYEVPLPVGEKFIKDFVNYWGLLAFSTYHFGKKVMGPDFDKRHTATSAPCSRSATNSRPPNLSPASRTDFPHSSREPYVRHANTGVLRAQRKSQRKCSWPGDSSYDAPSTVMPDPCETVPIAVQPLGTTVSALNVATRA